MQQITLDLICCVAGHWLQGIVQSEACCSQLPLANHSREGQIMGEQVEQNVEKMRHDEWMEG